MDRLLTLRERSNERIGSNSSGIRLMGRAREPEMSQEKSGTTSLGSSTGVSGNAVDSNLFSSSFSLAALESLPTSASTELAVLHRQRNKQRSRIQKRRHQSGTRPLVADSNDSPTFEIYKDPANIETSHSLPTSEGLTISEDPESSGENLLRRPPPPSSSNRSPFQVSSIVKLEAVEGINESSLPPSRSHLAVKLPPSLEFQQESSFTFDFDFDFDFAYPLTSIRDADSSSPEVELETDLETSEFDDFVENGFSSPTRPELNLFLP